MQLGDAGAGQFKTLVSLAILASVAYAAVKTLPVYVDNYQLQDHIQQLSTQLAVRAKPATPDEVGNEVLTFAQDHGIPLTPDNVKVTISRHVRINLDYTVPVDLTVYTLRLHFTPSADSPSL